jgi:uncharacterized protein (TIGR00369 family)
MAEERAGSGRGWDRVVGLEIESATADEVVGVLDIDPERHMQPAGILHGGVLCGIVETLASVGASINATAAGKMGAAGMENQTSFLRSVRGGTLRGRAVPLHKGRTTHVWEVRITDEQDRLVSRGVVRLVILEQRP